MSTSPFRTLVPYTLRAKLLHKQQIRRFATLLRARPHPALVARGSCNVGVHPTDFLVVSSDSWGCNQLMPASDARVLQMRAKQSAGLNATR